MKKNIKTIKELIHKEITPHLPFYMNFIHINDLRLKIIKHKKKRTELIEFIPSKKCPSLQITKISFYKPVSRLYNK